jgi:hypothetical protein
MSSRARPGAKPTPTACTQISTQIRPLLPETIEGVLDIGGGMGGIDALINHEYGGTLDVVIVDGDRDPPAKVAERRRDRKPIPTARPLLNSWSLTASCTRNS